MIDCNSLEQKTEIVCSTTKFSSLSNIPIKLSVHIERKETEKDIHVNHMTSPQTSPEMITERKFFQTDEK